jgi:hypothetical protein
MLPKIKDGFPPPCTRMSMGSLPPALSMREGRRPRRSPSRHRLNVKIFGLLEAAAEGPVAIAAVFLIVFFLTRSLW